MDPANLPLELTSFIGRDSDLANLTPMFPETRSITITGPGGCGKTRLALQVANKIREQFHDGVWWVNLAPLLDPKLIPQLITHALGLRPAADQPMMDALINYVRSKELLLVLDNCEHLNDACAAIAHQLLSEAPALCVLATSRTALLMVGEVIYPLTGLPWPPSKEEVVQDGQSEINLQALMRFEAVRLFVERAQSITPKFILTPENAPAVIEICRQLDGLPLALELASARVNVLSVQEIAARLNDRLTLLTTGKRSGVEPRHYSLRVAIDWSYALLTAEEQKLFRRLAVFAGGCSFDTVESICRGAEIASEQMLDLMSALVAKSLVVAETTREFPARYWLLETIREYAFEKLNKAGELTQLRNRHLDLFLTTAEAAMPKQFEVSQQFWLNWAETEHDNLRAALAWALESKQIEAGLRLASALIHFWEVHGYIQEGLTWMERLLAVADEHVSLKVHVNALVFATFQDMVLGNPQAAMAHARKAVDLAEAIEESDNAVLAFAMDGLASAAKAAGDFQTSFKITEKNIHYYRQFEPSFYLGMCLLSQGENAIQLGYSEIARERLNESLALARHDGDDYRTAHTLNLLGDLARLEQNYMEAAGFYENGAVLLRQMGARRDLASLLSNLGYARLNLGDVDGAYHLFAESIAIHQVQQNRPGMIECLIGFGATAVKGGQENSGVRLLAAAEAISGQTSASVWRATRVEFERYLKLAQERLSPASFRRELVAGRSLSLEQAMACAQQLQIHPVPNQRAKVNNLTEREAEIAVLIALGKTNREIADELVLSKRTVEKHAANILSKLDLSSRAQLIRWAIEHGLAKRSK